MNGFIFLRKLNDTLNLLIKNNFSENKLNQKQIQLSLFFVWKPENAKLAIKSGLGFLLGSFVWIQSSWPYGLQGLISAFVISIQKNTADASWVAVQRIGGCILGGSIALLLLHFFYFNLLFLLICLLGASFIFSYQFNVNEKWGYFFWQSCFAFIMALVQNGGPPTTIKPALQRLAGMIIGVSCMSLIICYIIWPVYSQRQLNQLMNSLFKDHTELYQEVFIEKQIEQENFKNRILNFKK